jgi:hypothetical protein
MRAVIASSCWNAIAKDGDTFSMQLEIGLPYQVQGAEFEEWACPVSLTPLFGRLADIHGCDAVQALALAMGLARNLLQQFLQDGGRLLADDGSELTIDAILPCVADH